MGTNSDKDTSNRKGGGGGMPWSNASPAEEEVPDAVGGATEIEGIPSSFGIETLIEEGDGTVRNQFTMGGVTTVVDSGTLRSCSFVDDNTAPSGMSSCGDANTEASGMSCTFVNGSWVCLPYKVERLAQQIRYNSPGSGRRTAIIETLQDMGVKVFIIDAKSIKSTEDIVMHIRRVVGYVARENSIEPRTGPLGFQRCLLYQDHQGRLFNLMLPAHSTGPAKTFQEYMESFSGREAMIAATVLCRSLPCMTESK